MRLSQKLGINVSQYEMDFFDTDIDIDSPLYIDPFLISSLDNEWTNRANFTIKSFFNTFKNVMLQQDYNKAKQLFAFMSEPKENCLGVSRKGTTNGKGVGDTNSTDIVESIIASNAIEKGLVNNIEDLLIFVDDIGKDKLSDMTTNIIRKELIEYTQSQCKFWKIQMKRDKTLPYWNPKNQKWVYTETDLLVIDGREILLIPKFIVSPINIYDTGKYQNNYIVESERDFHLKRQSALVKMKKLKNGNIKYYVLKKDVSNSIAQEIKTGEYFSTKDYIREYTLSHPELYSKFVERSKTVTCALTNEQIIGYIEKSDINKIIDVLIHKLQSIPTGKENATEYHHFAKSLLEMIWYPSLINPVIEQEILDGRKRIDIVMDNNDSKNFFYKLQKICKIFCPYIFFECKNYGKDVANPEIDQLAGRFSPRRGQFGFLLCRELENEELFNKRCRDTYGDDRGLIIGLTDKDIIAMLEMIKSDNVENMWRLLEEKKRNIILS